MIKAIVDDSSANHYDLKNIPMTSDTCVNLMKRLKRRQN